LSRYSSNISQKYANSRRFFNRRRLNNRQNWRLKNRRSFVLTARQKPPKISAGGRAVPPSTLNGTYQLKQKCRLESDEDFKLYILAERSAEQIQFYRTILRSNKQYYMRWTVGGTNCSILPYAENLVKIKSDENFIYCEKDIKLDRKLVQSWSEKDKELQSMVSNNFSKIYDMVFQGATFICGNDSTVEMYPNRKSCHFTTIKLNTDKSLPLCDDQNSGLNTDGEVDISTASLEKKTREKQVFWLYGDSTSRNLAMESGSVLGKKQKRSGFSLKNITSCHGAERWVLPEKYKMENLTFYRMVQASPTMSNKNCNAGLSVRRVLNGIDEYISQKPNDSIILFAPGFHYTNWNPYVFARDVSVINKHSIELMKKYPKIKILFREVHWSSITSSNSRCLTTWIQKKQNSIARKILDPSIIKIVNTFDYVFTRWTQMKTNNVHTYGVQRQSIARMILNNI